MAHEHVVGWRGSPVHLASYRGKRQRKSIAKRMEGSEGFRVLGENSRERYSGKTGEESLPLGEAATVRLFY